MAAIQYAAEYFNNGYVRPLIHQVKDWQKWSSEVCSSYRRFRQTRPTRDNLNDAFFGRQREIFAGLIIKKVIPRIKETADNSPQQILNVGPGALAYEPWELLSSFWANGLMPDITVLDGNPNCLTRLQQTEQINFPAGFNVAENIKEKSKQAVFRYAQNFAQTFGLPEVVGDSHEFSLAIPTHLRSLFKPELADLVLWEPSETELGSFSLVVALNVTISLMHDEYYLVLGFLNMLRATAVKGQMIIFGDYGNSDLLANNLMQEAFGYKAELIKWGSYDHPILLIEKTAQLV